MSKKEEQFEAADKIVDEMDAIFDNQTTKFVNKTLNICITQLTEYVLCHEEYDEDGVLCAIWENEKFEEYAQTCGEVIGLVQGKCSNPLEAVYAMQGYKAIIRDRVNNTARP